MARHTLFLVALLAGALASAACQPEPDLLCDGARVVWPYLEVTPSLDTQPEDGLQIDFELRTSLIPGTEAILVIIDEAGEELRHPSIEYVADDGTLVFRDVTVPVGRITASLTVQNACGVASTSRSYYAWDGLGYPRCALSVDVEPRDVPFFRPLGVLGPEHDRDPDQPGVELVATVEAGRPDMTVTLFVLDVASGEHEVLEQPTDADGLTTFAISLDQGEQALRAVCRWEPEELSPSSITRRFWVDTVPPECELVEPADRVQPIDDEDPDTDGLQFTLRGQASGVDVAGQPALFTVNGEEFPGTPLDEGGQSTAIGTVFVEIPPEPQVITFAASDHAGNTCEATATY